MSTHGRPSLPCESVTHLLTECARTAAAEVWVGQVDTAVVVRSSWALNRARRWSTGDVRFLDPDAVNMLGSTTVLSAQRLGLTSVAPGADLYLVANPS